MYIEFRCSQQIVSEQGQLQPCQKKLKAERRHIGQQVRCPRCRQLNVVPATVASAATAVSAPAATRIHQAAGDRPASSAAAGHSAGSLDSEASRNLQISAFDPFVRCPHCGGLLDKSNKCSHCRYRLPTTSNDKVPLARLKPKPTGFLLYLKNRTSLKSHRVTLAVAFVIFLFLAGTALQTLAFLILGVWGWGVFPLIVMASGVAAYAYAKWYRLATRPAEPLTPWQRALWDLVLAFVRMRHWPKPGKSTPGVLDLRQQHMDDKQLFLRKDLRKVMAIDLEGQPITDKGLLALRPHTHLKFLVLKNTNVSVEGVFRLQQEIPETWIWY